MADNKKAIDELVLAILREEGINFRGVTIGDNLETVIAKEGNLFDDRTGTLPNYKYFIELGEMEELELVYAYRAETKAVYAIEVTLKTYPKYFWEQAGGTNSVEFYEQLMNNRLVRYVPHFSAAINQIRKHFEAKLGSPGVGHKDYVHDKAHHDFVKYTWIFDDLRLTMMTFVNDTKYPEGAVSMELKLMLTEI